jgi:TPR repeat protein
MILRIFLMFLALIYSIAAIDVEQSQHNTPGKVDIQKFLKKYERYGNPDLPEEGLCPSTFLYNSDNDLPSLWALVGLCYWNGVGVEKNLTKAFEYFKKSADKDLRLGLFLVGHSYLYGKGTEKNESLGITYLRDAAVMRQGSALALYDLGVCYENGIGVPKDSVNAFIYYNRAAQKGNINALVNLGRCYLYGIGVEKDCSKAVEPLEKAAEKGYVFTKELENIKKVAEEGNAHASYFLGVCYANGIGVDKKIDTATQYYKKAADAGFECRTNDNLQPVIPKAGNDYVRSAQRTAPVPQHDERYFYPKAGNDYVRSAQRTAPVPQHDERYFYPKAGNDHVQQTGSAAQQVVKNNGKSLKRIASEDFETSSKRKRKISNEEAFRERLKKEKAFAKNT